MGTIIKTIGTAGGRDYSTISAFVAALPANLVTDGNSYVGQCYNDSEFSEQVSCSGHTTDATHFITITAAAGQSFQDNASVRANALVYNQSNGAALKWTGNNPAFKLQDNFTVISRLQIKNTGAYGALVSANSAGTTNTIYKDLLCDSACTNLGGSTTAVLDIGSFNGSGGFLINVVVFLRVAGSNGIKVAGTTTAIGCSAILTTGATANKTGFVSQYGSNLLKSCCSFGFTTAADTVAWSASSKNNATDKSSGLPGTSNQFSVTYNATTPFTQAGTTGTDLRAVASTSLAANGILDATNAPNDISGTARANPPTIGHWELSTAFTWQDVGQTKQPLAQPKAGVLI